MKYKYPTSWVMCNIGDIAAVVSGGTPKTSDESNFSAPGTGFPWLTPSDLSGYTQKYISHGSRDLSENGLATSSAKLMPAGTLLFSSRAPIGYVAIAESEISTNQGFKNFVFPRYIVPSYAYFYLKSIKRLAESFGTGSTFKEISSTTAKKLPFILPPLAEQKEIAERLDRFLEQVDGVKAHLALIPDIVKRFRQSVLSAAVSGKLTDDWQSSNAFYYSQLDTEILNNPKLTKLQSLNKDDVDSAINIFGGIGWDRWKIYPLEALIDPERGIRYGIVQTGEPDPNGIPTIRCGDVKPLDVNISQLKRVSAEIEVKYSRTRLVGNEVVLAIRGTVGNAAVITKEIADSPINISREIAMIPVRKNINPYFIALILQSPGGYRCLAEKTRGVAQKGINLADVKRLVTPLPPLDEQAEIVRRVEQLFTYIDTIEQHVKVAKARVDNLTQAILVKAFQGELTVDWRSAHLDLISGKNSAEVMLEKIKLELDVIKAQPKTKNRALKKTGTNMSTKIVKVVEALKQVGEPLSGQQLFSTAGYPSDSTTEQLEQFFLDIREALTVEKSIVKLDRTNDGQDWFTLAGVHNAKENR